MLASDGDEERTAEEGGANRGERGTASESERRRRKKCRSTDANTGMETKRSCSNAAPIIAVIVEVTRIVQGGGTAPPLALGTCEFSVRTRSSSMRWSAAFLACTSLSSFSASARLMRSTAIQTRSTSGRRYRKRHL